MKQIGKRQCTQLIADILVDIYGDTLQEDGTDVEMAAAVVKALSPYMLFSNVDISPKEFEKMESTSRSRNTIRKALVFLA